MYEVKILVVDDQAKPHKDIRGHIEVVMRESDVSISVIDATSKAEALKEMRKHHFDLALVDLHLSTDSRTDGLEVLLQLREKRPSCRRIAMTDKYRRDEQLQAIDEMFTAVDPNTPLCDGIINKKGQWDLIERTISEFTRRLGTSTVSWDSRDLRLIHQRVNKTVHPKRPSKRSQRSAPPRPGGPTYSQHELQAVLSSLMGRADRRGGAFEPPTAQRGVAERFEDRAVRLIEFPDSGRSRSVVFFARCEMSKGQPGAILVIKIASRTDIVEEAGRYNLFLRLGARHSLRPDLLNWVTADTIGALAYSFGGSDDVSDTPDLERVVKRLATTDTSPTERGQMKVRLETALNHVAGPSTASWYVNGFDLDIGMVELVGLEVDEAIGSLTTFADRLQASIDVRREQAPINDSTLVGHRVMVPNQAPLLLPKTTSIDELDDRLANRYRACIVHGDLNLSNVLIDADPTDCMLIDFRHSGPGPRLYDYATLAVHARLVEATQHEKEGRNLAEDMTAFGAAIKDEQLAWNDKAMPRPRGVEHGWSAAVLNRFLADLMAETFKDDQIAGGNDIPTEYLMTTLVYALKMLEIDSLSNAARARLMITVAVTFKRLLEGMELPTA